MKPKILPFYNQPKRVPPAHTRLLPLVTAGIIREQESREAIPNAFADEEAINTDPFVLKVDESTLPPVMATENTTSNADSQENDSIGSVH